MTDRAFVDSTASTIRPGGGRPTTASSPIRKIVAGVLIFLLIGTGAVAGYMAAGWELGESIYMVVITIFGVGYGEVRPVETAPLRLLTICLIVSGYAAVIYIVGGFAQMLIDGELNKALGERKMTRDIDRLEQHTIIAGMGRLGTMLAEQLAEAGRPFVIIDNDEETIQDASEHGWLTIEGDATEEDTLSIAGIERARTIASVLSDDAVNLFVTITAREMNPDATVIARGEDPRTEKKLLRSGADQVILPTAVGAQKVAQLIVRPSAESLIEGMRDNESLKQTFEDLNQIGLDFDDFVVESDSPLVNQPLSEIKVRGNHGFLIVGIRGADGSTSLHPADETVLQAGDVVIVLGYHDDIPDLARRFASPAKQKQMLYRGVRV